MSKDRVGLSILAFGALCILIGLGIWQLKRLSWKTDLISRFKQALSAPPVDYRLPALNAPDTHEFLRVKISGEFQSSQTIKLLIATPQAFRAQTQEGFGYLLFTPLRFDGGVVFVNRGFAPEIVSNQVAAALPGPASVTGIVRRSERPGWFTPPPEPAKRLFYAADIPAMAAAVGLNGKQAVFAEYIDADPSPASGAWPKSRDPRDLLAAIPNRHLEYALTWFGLAAALCVVFGFYMIRTQSP